MAGMGDRHNWGRLESAAMAPPARPGSETKPERPTCAEAACDLPHSGLTAAPPARRSAARRRLSGLGSLAREGAETLLLAGLMTLTLQRVAQPRLVEGSSMEPTLHTSQRVLVSSLAYHLTGTLHRGDVVVFAAWGDEEDYIKRVIGLPGETIAIRDGVVLVNDRPLAEPYVTRKDHADSAPVTLGPDEYFVLGDNRPNSADSRYFGPLTADRIVGPAFVSLWPPGLIGH